MRWLATAEHLAFIERAESRASGVGAAGRLRAEWAQAFGAVVDAGQLGARRPWRPPAERQALAAAGATGATAMPIAAHRLAAERRLRIELRSASAAASACRVRFQCGTMVRIALMRMRSHFRPRLARARPPKPSASDFTRCTDVRAGRYAIVVRIGPAARARERRMSLVLR